MAAKKVRAAAIQVRPIPKKVKETIFQGVRLAKTAAERGADIVVLPEHWLPEEVIPTPMDPIPGLQAVSEEYGIPIVGGAFFEKVNGKLRLSSPVIGTDGEVLGRQFKVHLFGREKKLAKAGNDYGIFKLGDYKVGVLVCYDIDFPEVSRIFTLKGADLLLCPSRIISRGIGPWQQYLTVRSLENRIPIVAPNVYAPPWFNGHSTIISLKQDPRAKIALPSLVSTSKKGTAIVTDDLDLALHARLRRARFADRRPDTYN
ncbi:MAG TPA: carbon-nitrogen hydrolase family protein [Candidatus Bathyarchaeia archaeon]|nr:carbon-nitrogen hydrolase family protein [Candidatus Bathyarchaeia archaeon]